MYIQQVLGASEGRKSPSSQIMGYFKEGVVFEVRSQEEEQGAQWASYRKAEN